MIDIDIDVNQIQEFADDLMFYAATESGFFTDGERFCLSNEQLAEMQAGNFYDFTDLLDEFCSHIIFKLKEYEALKKYEGVTQ